MTTVHLPFDSRIFHKECRSLARAGWDVHLIQVCERDETVDGVKIHHLPEPPNRFKRMLFWPWKAYKKVLSIRPRPAIVHFHDPELLPAGRLLSLQGFSVVYDVHENVAKQILTKPYLSPLLRRLASRCYSFAEKLLVSRMATVHVLESIARRYPNPNVTVRNFPTLGTVTSNERLDNPRPRLLYVGSHITAERGIYEMLQMSVELLKRDVDFELRLVGHMSDDVRSSTEDKIRRFGMDEHVVLLGHVSFEQAQKEIAKADIGLHIPKPTANALNSLPIKIFEYMYFEIPVLVSDFKCWRQYVEQIASGIMVDPNNTKEISNKAQLLIEHPETAAKMGQNGHLAVLERFNWQVEFPKLLKFYERIISPKRDRFC